MEGRFNGGFFGLPVWGAYIWRGLFSEFYGNSQNDGVDDLQSTLLILFYLHHFPLLAAVFLLVTSWITVKIVAFYLEVSCCCVHSPKRKLAGPGSVFPAFCHATFHHAFITCCNVARAG